MKRDKIEIKLHFILILHFIFNAGNSPRLQTKTVVNIFIRKQRLLFDKSSSKGKTVTNVNITLINHRLFFMS